MKKEKRYKKIIKNIIIYLIVNKKKIIKNLQQQDFNKNKTKYFRFGTNLFNDDDYIIEIKIYE